MSSITVACLVHSTLTPAFFLSHSWDKGELFLSSTLDAELATRSITASLVQSEFDTSFGAGKGEPQIKMFEMNSYSVITHHSRGN